MQYKENKNTTLANILCPSNLGEFIGQKDIVSNLKIFIFSSKKRRCVLDHILLAGPPGLGKTTLARLIAKELAVDFVSTTAPAIAKTGDLVGTLINLGESSVFFIDEVHRLNVSIEEYLYSAMDSFKISLKVGEGAGTSLVPISLPPFTLISATTRPGLITPPMLSRFGITFRVSFYHRDELVKILNIAAEKLKISITEKACEKIANSSRGTPRQALILLKRAIDFQLHYKHVLVDEELVYMMLKKMKINENGLNNTDVLYLSSLQRCFNGGPVGVITLSHNLSESVETLEAIIEPFLVQNDFIEITSRGRRITERGKFFLDNIT